MEIKFLVQGSSDEPYEVRFYKNGNNLSAYCSCTAGINGTYCKHRINILNTDTKAIVSDNVKDVEVIQAWLPGTDVDAALIEIKAAELELAEAKRKVTATKKALALAMRD